MASILKFANLAVSNTTRSSSPFRHLVGCESCSAHKRHLFQNAETESSPLDKQSNQTRMKEEEDVHSPYMQKYVNNFDPGNTCNSAILDVNAVNTDSCFNNSVLSVIPKYLHNGSHHSCMSCCMPDISSQRVSRSITRMSTRLFQNATHRSRSNQWNALRCIHLDPQLQSNGEIKPRVDDIGIPPPSPDETKKMVEEVMKSVTDKVKPQKVTIDPVIESTSKSPLLNPETSVEPIAATTQTDSTDTIASSKPTLADIHGTETVASLPPEKPIKLASDIKSSTSGSTTSSGTTKPSSVVVAKTKPTLLSRFVAELKHYYHGFRLLGIDLRICCKLAWNILRGKSLTRRERRLLVRTTADMFRLVPFLVFVIVPFMEFLLPVAVKLFPGMLPSTFQEDTKEKEKLRKQLAGKLEMAKFLQDTLEEMSNERREGINEAQQKKIVEFRTFMAKVRSSGEHVDNEEILHFSKLFTDELTLENLDHRSLIAICQLMGVSTKGTTAFLRFQLRRKLMQLEFDDRTIRNEGITSLTTWELMDACRERGMRASGLSVERLRAQLTQWIELHLNKKVPVSLLLLSRALYMTEIDSSAEVIVESVKNLPEKIVEKVPTKLQAITPDDVKDTKRVDHKAKREKIKEEEMAIKKEKAEASKAVIPPEGETKKLVPTASILEPVVEPAEVDAAAAAASDAAMKTVQSDVPSTPVTRVEPELSLSQEVPAAPPAQEKVVEPVAAEVPIAVAKAEPSVPVVAEVPAEPVTVPEPVPEPVPSTTPKFKEVATIVELKDSALKPDEVAMSELEEIETVLEQVASARISAKILTKESLKDLKDEVEGYQEEMADFRGAVAAAGGKVKDATETKGAQRLVNRVGKLIKQMDDVVEKLHAKKESLQEDIESELTPDEEKLIKRNLVTINDMMLLTKGVRKLPDDNRALQILEVLDMDKDGKIDVDEIRKVIQLMGEKTIKNQSVSRDQIARLVNLLRNEEITHAHIEEFIASDPVSELTKETAGSVEETQVDTAQDLTTDHSSGTDPPVEKSENADKS